MWCLKMAPGGLIISKLALHASVDEDVLKGLLCMKVSLAAICGRHHHSVRTLLNEQLTRCPRS